MTNDHEGQTNAHKVVSHEEWLSARRELLEKEKAWTRQDEESSRLQRALPWEVVAKDYVFDCIGVHLKQRDVTISERA